jgi:ribosomal protein S18 acetylase RimI-like enzyme
VGHAVVVDDRSELKLVDQPSTAEIEAASWIWIAAESIRVVTVPYESYIEDQRAGFVRTMARTDAWLTLAARGDEIVGLVGGLRPTPEEHAAYLAYLAVGIGHRNRGIGKALISRAIARGTEMRAGTMLLTVHESNVGARRLYEKTGWSTTGRRETTPIDDAPLVEYSLELTGA